MTLPWHARNHQDALDGMLMLSLEERGAYNTALDLIYIRSGPIPDNARWLSGYMGVSLRRWSVIRASLLVKGKLYEINVNGVPSLMNQRAAIEIENAAKLSRNFSESGAKGGRKSAELRTKPNENNGPAQATLQATVKLKDIDTDTEKKSPPSPLWGASESTLSQSYDRAFAAYPETGRATTTPDTARKAWAEVAKAVDPEALISAVQAFAASPFAKADAGKRVPSFQKWLKQGRYTAWIAATDASAFQGPAELRREAIAEKGEGWVKAYLDPCQSREGVLLPKTTFALEKLQKEIPHLLRAHGVTVVWERAA